MVSEEDFESLKRKYSGGSTYYYEIRFTEKIKKVILSPSEFFERIKAEKGISEAFKYLAILSLVNLVVGIVSFMLSIPFISPLGNLSSFLPLLGALSTALGIVIPVVIYISSLILSFVGAGFIHLFVKLFKGKGDYSNTYKALIYASTPSLLFGWVPWVGIIFGLYSFYLSLKGISKLHEVSMVRAFIMLITPIVVIILAIIAIAGSLYTYYASQFLKLSSSGSLGQTAGLLEIVDFLCLPDGNANIIIRNLGTSSIKSNDISISKDGSPLKYGQFTIDKDVIEVGSTAVIKASCTTPGQPRTCKYTVNDLPVIVYCFG
jgi:hypothetical protein